MGQSGGEPGNRVAEDAVCREPVSALNSLLTGKNTGNFVEFGRPNPAVIGVSNLFSLASGTERQF